MPQLVVAMMLLFGTNFDTAFDHLDHVFGGSTVSLATSIHAGLHDLALEQAEHSSGTLELRHSIATC